MENLDSGKTVIFATPISGYNNHLVRTGNIQEDKSLVHAILTAYSKDYFLMDKKTKKDYYTKFIENIVDIKSYEEKNENYTRYKEQIIKFVEFMYADNQDELKTKNFKNILKQISNNPVYDLIPEIILKEDMLDILKPSSEVGFSKYKDEVKHSVKNYLDSVDVLNQVDDNKKVELIKKNIKHIISIIIDDIKTYEYNSFKNNILSQDDFKLINTIMDKIKTNIYVIDSTNKLPSNFNKLENNKNSKSIILIKLDNTYETIGLLLPKNKIQREFDSDNFLVQRINTFLFEPSKIVSTYPDLLQYLEPNSKPLKNKKNILTESDSDSESENENSDTDI
jgi:hypothetical protein